MRGQAAPAEADLGPGGAQPQVQGRQEDPDHEHPEVTERSRRMSANTDLHQHVRMLRSIRQRPGQVTEPGNMFRPILNLRDRL